MMRLKTQLEESLIKKGFKLAYKTYTGKHSQFVEYYVYEGSFREYFIRAYLSRNRENIVSFSMSGDRWSIYNTYDIEKMKNDYESVKEFLENKDDELTDDEVVEIAEVNNE